MENWEEKGVFSLLEDSEVMILEKYICLTPSNCLGLLFFVSVICFTLITFVTENKNIKKSWCENQGQ